MLHRIPEYATKEKTKSWKKRVLFFYVGASEAGSSKGDST